jgi:hypothetical protein
LLIVEKEAVLKAATRTPSAPDTCASTKAGVGPASVSDVLFASRGYAVGPDGVGRADPTALIYRVISRPAVAEIVGDGRPWTVLMISLLSMPCR